MKDFKENLLYKEARKKLNKLTIYYFLSSFILIFFLIFLYVRFNKTEIYLSTIDSVLYGFIIWGFLGVGFMYFMLKESKIITKIKKDYLEQREKIKK